MPVLHNLAQGQYEGFKRCASALIGADKRVDLFEWMLRRVLMNRLGPVFEPGARAKPRVKF